MHIETPTVHTKGAANNNKPSTSYASPSVSPHHRTSFGNQPSPMQPTNNRNTNTNNLSHSATGLMPIPENSESSSSIWGGMSPPISNKPLSSQSTAPSSTTESPIIPPAIVPRRPSLLHGMKADRRTSFPQDLESNASSDYRADDVYSDPTKATEADSMESSLGNSPELAGRKRRISEGQGEMVLPVSVPTSGLVSPKVENRQPMAKRQRLSDDSSSARNYFAHPTPATLSPSGTNMSPPPRIQVVPPGTSDPDLDINLMEQSSVQNGAQAHVSPTGLIAQKRLASSPRVGPTVVAAAGALEDPLDISEEIPEDALVKSDELPSTSDALQAQAAGSKPARIQPGRSVRRLLGGVTALLGKVKEDKDILKSKGGKRPYIFAKMAAPVPQMDPIAEAVVGKRLPNGWSTANLSNEELEKVFKTPLAISEQPQVSSRSDHTYGPLPPGFWEQSKPQPSTATNAMQDVINTVTPSTSNAITTTNSATISHTSCVDKPHASKPVYADWSAEELEAFDHGLEAEGKAFTKISRNYVPTRTTSECVEAFYKIKHQLRSMRIKAYRKKTESEYEDYVRYVAGLNKYVTTEAKRLRTEKGRVIGGSASSSILSSYDGVGLAEQAALESAGAVERATARVLRTRG